MTVVGQTEKNSLRAYVFRSSVESRCDAVALGSNISVAAPFVRRCLTGSTMSPFSHPAHRTGQAGFPHPALGQNFTPSPTARRAQAGSSVRGQSARKDARTGFRWRRCTMRTSSGSAANSLSMTGFDDPGARAMRRPPIANMKRPGRTASTIPARYLGFRARFAGAFGPGAGPQWLTVHGARSTAG